MALTPAINRAILSLRVASVVSYDMFPWLSRVWSIGPVGNPRFAFNAQPSIASRVLEAPYLLRTCTSLLPGRQMFMNKVVCLFHGSHMFLGALQILIAGCY
ncbi:hypothetical protein BOTBODRAFT_33420 [Botryobasidium botryosum FD-172 SS1]|uniref:Uncharacterized protein n=1 Tax=Botryobasidium botryosum (strain FD-172 SS1) TaxID=930990 RepID=A0A067MPB2_BOTB1|nr:hypothetical protein BOTBODRAFT_33420 [Botryobasidium botryosum FD-172 SS1]